MTPAVVVDTNPMRGWSGSWREIARGWIVFSVTRGGALALASAAMIAPLGPVERYPAVFAIWGAGSIGAMLLACGQLALASPGTTRRIASAYGLAIEAGIYTSQHRRLEVHFPPADLRALLERVIGSIAPGVRVTWRGDDEMVAVIPRIGRNWMKCRATLKLRWGDSSDQVAIDFLSEMLGYFAIVDFGRSLIIAEEFQLRLKRLIETGVLAEPYDWGTGYEFRW